MNRQLRAQTHFLMSFEVKTTTHFEREAKILAKRYKSFKADMKDFVESLEKNPMQGDRKSTRLNSSHVKRSRMLYVIMLTQMFSRLILDNAYNLWE